MYWLVGYAYSCMMGILYLRVTVILLYRLIWRLTLLEIRRPHQHERKKSTSKHKNAININIFTNGTASNNKIQQQIISRVNSLSFICFLGHGPPRFCFFVVICFVCFWFQRHFSCKSVRGFHRSRSLQTVHLASVRVDLKASKQASDWTCKCLMCVMESPIEIHNLRGSN